MTVVTRAPGVSLQGKPDAEILERLREGGIQLRLEEARSLLVALERDPTETELKLLDSLWSEHCSYKSTRFLLRRLPTEGPHVVLGPGSDAGIVRLPRGGAPPGGAESSRAFELSSLCVALGHESHNHPSQLLPQEGAATGIGGIVRDVYCMGADVVGVLDALRFGDPTGPQGERVQEIARGVVRGICQYGNALGVPNLGGQVEFDSAYDANCLVNVVALGILEEDDIIPSRAPAEAAHEPYVLLLVGKPTDSTGLGGAAFASGALDLDEKTQRREAVQLADPFFKRLLTEANKAAFELLRRHGAPFGMKDLGAAGLGGAAVEMASAAGLGLDLDLDQVPTDSQSYPASVLLVSETQERYVFAVPESVGEELRLLYERDFELGHMVRGAGARVVGRFVAEPQFRVRQAGSLHVDLPCQLVTDAPEADWPRKRRQAATPVSVRGQDRLEARDVIDDLRCVLGSLAGGSRHRIFEHYDSDVQGRTMLRPGDADAGVLLVEGPDPVGIAVAVGGSSRAAERDPRRAGAMAVCEAARNVAAVGATPWALTDCLNHGSPETPESMQDLEDVVEGLCDAAQKIGWRGASGHALPFVSGNVSLYNESRAGQAIPPSPIVCCLGVLGNFSYARSTLLKTSGSVLFRLGTDCHALGGSLYAEVTGQHDLLRTDAMPVLDLEQESRRLDVVLDAFDTGLVESCHDVGEGGLLLALVEMALGRAGDPGLGIQCELDAQDSPLVARLFAETTGFVCEVRPEHVESFVAVCRQHEVVPHRVGHVLETPTLRIQSGQNPVVEVDLQSLARVWHHALEPFLGTGGKA